MFLNLMLNPSFGTNSNGGTFGPIGFADEARAVPPAAASAFAAVDRNKANSFDSRYGFWGAAFGGSASIDGNATTGSHDTNSQVYGFAAGLDYHATPDTILGFALGGGGTHWGLDQGLGSGRSDMFQAGVYAKTRWGAAYLSGALAYSFHDVTTDRTVTIAGTDMLEAKFKANMVSGRLEGGYRYAMPWVGVTPYGAVQVQSIALPSYGETATSGSSMFALSFHASQTVTTTRTPNWVPASTRPTCSIETYPLDWSIRVRPGRMISAIPRAQAPSSRRCRHPTSPSTAPSPLLTAPCSPLARNINSRTAGRCLPSSTASSPAPPRSIPALASSGRCGEPEQCSVVCFWHLADNPAALAFVRFRTTADKD